MILHLIGTGYIVVHFAVYALLLRRARALKTERGIFLYHAVSYVLLAGLTAFLGWWWRGAEIGAGVLFVAGLHGVYSLSFLELWSLAQGSYSLAILTRVAALGGTAAPAELTGLQAVGSSKQQDRIESLKRLGLLRPDGRPGTTGRIAAHLLRALLGISNGRITN